MLGASLLMTLGLAIADPPIDAEASACHDGCIISYERVSDDALGKMRGGVRLPNGLVVVIGIDIQTRVDGVLVLHTVYTSDGPDAGIRVYSAGTNATGTAPATATITTRPTIGVPVVTVDRSPGGTTINPGQATPATTINLVSGSSEGWLTGKGQTPVPVTANGPSIAAPPGDVHLEISDAGASVILVTPSLEVRQLVGRATGVVIANTASDRSIETVSSINVDLRGLSPQLVAAEFAVQRMAVETTLVRVPGGF
jgi:hypothetical protein